MFWDPFAQKEIICRTWSSCLFKRLRLDFSEAEMIENQRIEYKKKGNTTKK